MYYINVSGYTNVKPTVGSPIWPDNLIQRLEENLLRRIVFWIFNK